MNLVQLYNSNGDPEALFSYETNSEVPSGTEAVLLIEEAFEDCPDEEEDIYSFVEEQLQPKGIHRVYIKEEAQTYAL